MTENKDFEVNTRHLLGTIWKDARLIALIALGCGIAVLLGSLLVPGGDYTSEAIFCVDTGAKNPTSQSVTAARELTRSCAVLLYTQSCLEGVSDLAEAPVTPKNLTGEAIGETEFFRVTARADSPDGAVKIAAAVEAVLPDLAEKYLSGGKLLVVDSPDTAKRAYPNYLGLGACGFLLGGLIATAAVAAQAVLAEKRSKV